MCNVVPPAFPSIFCQFMLVGWLDKLDRGQVVSEEILAGTEIPGGWRRTRVCLSLHRHHQNDSCFQTGSDESRFNVSLINYREGQSHKAVSTDHNF